MISAQDREILENKYHLVDQPFDAFDRMNHHGYDYDPATGLTDEEIHAGLKALSGQLGSELAHPVIKARLFAYVLDHTRIDVNEHDYFIGIYTWNRPLAKYTLDKWNAEVEACFPKESETLRSLNRSGSNYGGLDFDHTIPDWDSIMELGFPGILQRARDCHARLKAEGTLTEKQEAYFQGVEIEYTAVIRFVDRLYQYALTKSFEKAPKIAECLKHLRDGAPQTTYDAMQLIFIYFMLSESIDRYQVRSLGYGLDGTLYPFYVNDLKNGVSKEEIEHLMSYFLMQWSAIGNYWGQPFYLGGSNPDGTTRVNELSHLILDVYDRLGIYNPKIQIKASLNTPRDFIMQAMEMIRGGSTSIVFCSEDHIVRTIMSRGGTYEEAVTAAVSGCYEYKIKAGSVNITNLYPSLIKPISLVFDNGYDRFSGQQIGPKTGDVTQFTSFKQFYQAYLAQVKYEFETLLDSIEQLETRIADINPALLYSATIPACMETMTDALDCGIENDTELVVGGLGTATDAVMAVYELVYEKQLTTLSELKDALDKNWEGYEKLRAQALACRHKYGNGDPMADNYAKAILHFVGADIVAGRLNPHGGHTIIDAHSARAFLIHGEKTLATPDGRRAGEEISKNASPTPGMDKNGITALIRSATTLDTTLCNSGFCLDAMLHPSSVQGAEGLEVLYSVLMTYIRQGGGSIHFNIFNADQLRDAQKHPEKYKNLQVRVCGWNTLWNNMDKKEQDAYILRAENIQ